MKTVPPREPHRAPKPRPLNLRDVWARWAVRVATTGDPWAQHVCEFYRRLADQEPDHGKR